MRTGGSGSLRLDFAVNFGRGDTEHLILGPRRGVGESPHCIWFVLSPSLQKRAVFMVKIWQRWGPGGMPVPPISHVTQGQCK